MKVDRIKGKEGCPECKGEGVYHISIGDKNVPVKCGCVKWFEMAKTPVTQEELAAEIKRHLYDEGKRVFSFDSIAGALLARFKIERRDNESC